MDDRQIIEEISALAEEERRLEELHAGEGLAPSEQAELHQIEVTLDQLWDLLRQRRALRRSGRDPETATERPGEVVEHYLQ